MLDTSHSSQVKLQRARGRGHIGVRRVGETVKVCDLHQSGCAKVMIPRAYGSTTEAVFLNTAGGVTGGDEIAFSAEVGPSSALSLTTQTAERAYASTGAPGQVSIDLTVGQDAHLNWLPQETILFDRSNLRRKTRIDLLGEATLLAIEIVVLGRAAMGETPKQFQLSDHRSIWRNGRPLWIDPLELDADVAAAAAGLGTARAAVTLVYVGRDAEDKPRPHVPGLHSSAWDGRLVVRGAFADLWPLKQALLPYLKTLKATIDGGPLPRVWQM
ncbi:urease accessory protein UreD [Shimia ponticola]|uniref:urease accessory protein UreD n=1 Tax=Shimia ponticola TaxID=2582893 RepID=UPI00164C1D53|nr:urease accessory protein UreD [Shimia ponticola]